MPRRTHVSCTHDWKDMGQSEDGQFQDWCKKCGNVRFMTGFSDDGSPTYRYAYPTNDIENPPATLVLDGFSIEFKEGYGKFDMCRITLTKEGEQIADEITGDAAHELGEWLTSKFHKEHRREKL